MVRLRTRRCRRYATPDLGGAWLASPLRGALAGALGGLLPGGGPGYASETLNIMGFKYSFEYFRMGQSSVILVALFLVVFLCSLGIMKLRSSSEI